ncbi:MAG: hypothetical protein P8Y99_11730 [Calditrichaceae bacterium]
MNYLIRYILILFLFPLHLVLGGNRSLEEDISDGYLDDYSKIEAAFILSGVTDPDSMPSYLKWYDDLLTKIKSFTFNYDDPIGSARTVFMYLHSTWLKTYAEESTTLKDIVRNKEYNCVAATILYNTISEDLGWSCKAFETTSHVYTIFNNFGRDLIVENTSTMGFDILKNLKAYSRYLAKYYPESEVLKIGFDKLYYNKNSKGRIITNTELLGLLAYNRAYLAKKKHDYKKAYDFVLLAQEFNRDSRSNINFEIGLYFSWGGQLFKKKDFIQAFAVYADGYYRYPENEGLLKNTYASFYNALNINWMDKNWPESERLIKEMNDLQLLDDDAINNMKEILNRWMHYFNYKNDEKSFKEVEKYLK